MAVVDALSLAAVDERNVAERQVRMQEALLAALPPVLFGGMLSAFLLGFVPLSQVVIGGPTRYHVVSVTFAHYVVPSILGAVLVGGGLLGARRRLPRWSYTWVTGSVVVMLFALVILGDELPYLISPTADVLIIAGLLLVVAAVALIAARRGALDAGLVGLGFCAVFAVAVTFGATAGPFSRIDVGLLSAPAGLVFAALIIGYLRRSGVLKWAAVAMTAALATALIWGYKAVIFAGMPSFSDTSFHWKLSAVAAAGLLGPPLLARLLELLRPGEVV